MTPSRRTAHSTSAAAGARRTAQHVWVGTQPSPGVLVEWRREGERWQALVVYVESGRIVTAWLPVELVRPAGLS
jgi:hypothetical protein